MTQRMNELTNVELFVNDPKARANYVLREYRAYRIDDRLIEVGSVW
jgi:hypothetical protein